MKNGTKRYRPIIIGMHWIMLPLLVGVYACIDLHDLFPKGSDPREMLKTWHFMLGLTVLVLVWPRLASRLSAPAPKIEPQLPAWQEKATKLMQAALYVFMIIMPLGGWLMLSAAGKQIPFFGLHLPALIQENKALAKLIQEIHEAIGTAGYVLIGIHTLAACYHHWIRRDDTLVRILPRRD